MRLNHGITLLLVALTTAAATLHAQQAVDPVMPRAGSWGAEAVIGNFIGANGLYFSSPTAAWLAGLSFNLVHQSNDVSAVPGLTDQSGWLGSVDARLGRRWWSGGRGDRIQPLTGLGVLGGVSSNPGFQSWDAGGYGELGASYFFTPHLSLGASGELAVLYDHDRFVNTGPQTSTTRWIIRGNLVRVSASVYF